MIEVKTKEKGKKNRRGNEREREKRKHNKAVTKYKDKGRLQDGRE